MARRSLWISCVGQCAASMLKQKWVGALTLYSRTASTVERCMGYVEAQAELIVDPPAPTAGPSPTPAACRTRTGLLAEQALQLVADRLAGAGPRTRAHAGRDQGSDGR